MPDIFRSYNREDQKPSEGLRRCVPGTGVDVRWDTTLRAGEAYDEIPETVTYSTIFGPSVSPMANLGHERRALPASSSLCWITVLVEREPLVASAPPIR